MKKTITLTLIVPLYNEEKRVLKFLKALEGFSVPKNLKLEEVRFVNDGSTDQTVKVLSKWKEKVSNGLFTKVKIVSYKNNRGRGYALRKGLKSITTDYALYMDGDLDIPLSNIRTISKVLKSQSVDLILGSKKKSGSVCFRKRSIFRVVGSYGYTILSFLLLWKPYWDYQGGFKLFSKRITNFVVQRTTIDRWGFDVEVVYWTDKLGYKVVQIPLKWGAVQDGSKVRLFRDILLGVADMVKIRKDSFLWSARKLQRASVASRILKSFPAA